MRRTKPPVGTVLQIALPNGYYAYGRVLRDASIAIYDALTSEPQHPPIGSRAYRFVVGVYDDVLRSDDVAIVGRDPGLSEADDWPPPYCVRDPISGATKIYHHGSMRPATAEECNDLEPAAVWDLPHIIDRLIG
jgi:Immunity protein 26